MATNDGYSEDGGEEERQLLELEPTINESETKTTKHRNTVHMAVLVLAIMTLLVVGYLGGYYARRIHLCTSDLDMMPDAAKFLDTKTTKRMTNTSLGPGLNPIIWRNSPSREVDEAWDSLYTNSLLLITEDDLKRMGKSPEEYAHIPTSFGYGKRQYYAKFEHIHKIHCLNLIRKWVHADYYFPNGKPMHKGMVHVDHCIHSLLEDYLCHVNYGVYTYQWIDVEALPEPDFQVTRQCRDYGKLLDFAKSNRVDWDKRVVYYPKPEDAKVFEQDPIVKKLDEVWEKEHPDKITREGEKDLFKSRYQEAMDEWRRTGKIPVVESENMHP